MTKRYALSWSGGKDCMMVFHLLKNQGNEIPCLVTTAPIETGRTFGHDEKMELIEAQSRALGVPVHFIRCRYDEYTADFISDLTVLKKTFSLDGIAYGDIYTDAHFEWGENTASAAGVKAMFPLRGNPSDTPAMLGQFIETGYKAMIIRVRRSVMDPSYLGRNLDALFATDIAQTTCCPMGENGEFHTFVYDGPLFSEPVSIQKGGIIESDASFRLELFI